MAGLFKKAVALLIAAVLLCCTAGCERESFYDDRAPHPLCGDVIVVGGGIAALAAALEAARQGAAVLLFYDQPAQDRWLWNEGTLLTDEEEEETAEQLQAALAEYGGEREQSWPYRILASQAGEDMAWLAAETGVIWVRESPFCYRPDNLSSEQAHARLTEAAMLEGVRFFAGTTVRELIIESGAARGIIFEKAAGEPGTAYAPAVILADGGCLGDPALLAELNLDLTAASWRPVRDGTGLRLARAAGLDFAAEKSFAFAAAVEENGQWVRAEWPAGTVLIAGEEIIALDRKSAREATDALLGAPGGCGYLLVAEASLGREHNLTWPRFAGLDAFMEAYRLELPLLRRWFVQPRGYFLGRPVKAVAEYYLGGVAVNENGAALLDGTVLSGVYAAGETAGGLHGRGLMPGAALTEAVVWGRRVGRAAALESGR